MRKTLFASAILASALSITLTAHADAIDQFTFSFATPPGYLSANLVIDLPASPPPSAFNQPFGAGICHANCFSAFGQVGTIPYVFDFSSPTPNETAIDFAVTDPFFGPPNTPRAYRTIYAPNLFSGSVTDPTFLVGTFDAEYQPFFISPEFAGTITIEQLNNSTVPEPSTFALMATGIIGAITTLSRRVAHT